MQNRLRAAVLAVLGLMPIAAQGQAPGSGPSIKLIVPYAAGGLPDTVARIVGRRLQERLGQTVVIENRGGANGGIGMAALVGAPADGHTVRQGPHQGGVGRLQQAQRRLHQAGPDR